MKDEEVRRVDGGVLGESDRPELATVCGPLYRAICEAAKRQKCANKAAVVLVFSRSAEAQREEQVEVDEKAEANGGMWLDGGASVTTPLSANALRRRPPYAPTAASNQKQYA